MICAKCKADVARTDVNQLCHTCKEGFKSPSETFERVFSSGCSGCVRECVCGTTFFDASTCGNYDWEDGEFETLVARSELEPDKCIGQDHSVGTIILEGREYVIGCPYCSRPGAVEAWIINNAERIADYLNRRAEETAKHAERIKVKKP